MSLKSKFFIFLLTFVALAYSAAPADSTKPSKKGGLLGSLYPVEEDEAIHRGNILTGATLFLLQGNSDEDALNILFGDIYKAEGYTFTPKFLVDILFVMLWRLALVLGTVVHM